MNRSESIGKLAEALAKAQGAIEGAKKDKANPFFKSKYADLASVWDACREPLSVNGLSVVQLPELSEASVKLTTVLMHSSGETLSAELSAPLKETTAQAIGSLITYLRRYSLAAIVGVAPDEDDDGNAASGRTAPPHKSNGNHSKPPPAASPVPPEEQLYIKLGELLPESWTKAEMDKWTAANLTEIERLPAIWKDALRADVKKVSVRA